MRLYINITSIILSLVFFLNTPVALASEIKSIRDLYHMVNNVIKENKANQILFVAEIDSKQDLKWAKVKDSDSKKIFNKHLIKAKVYLFNGRIIKVVIMHESQSGDWENLSEYYFYEDGITAFIFHRLLTFQAYSTEEMLPPGPYILEKRIYFDKKGKDIKVLTKAYISKTKKETDAKYIYQIYLEEYRNAKQLPFYGLLEKDR